MREINVRLSPSLQEWATLSEEIDSFCGHHRLADGLRMDLQLACEEWFINIVVHGYEEGGIQPGHAPPIQAELRIEGPNVVATFRDGARAFNPLEQEEPDVGLTAEERSIGGLGIYLIKSKMDSCSYLRTEAGNEFTMRKKAQRRTE
ncbi:ATP-binding protein [Cohnella sp. AR92]|uniref:ATP-binding protein n=1 Tax=Cohnella sp. AR92 TaxID=648716 RepID=UPI000F8F7153|nr:ATP-binding protein [Cohnella sp. AR92]RUS45911.1 ATP-binding protein [Cohnella sp. AR92]